MRGVYVSVFVVFRGRQPGSIVLVWQHVLEPVESGIFVQERCGKLGAFLLFGYLVELEEQLAVGQLVFEQKAL